jgi:hypothetical protein
MGPCYYYIASTFNRIDECIASTFNRIDECEAYRRLIEAAGLGRVVSTWHTDASMKAEEALGKETLTVNPEAGLPMAERDISDLNCASALIFLSGGDAGRGGKHVELGYALGLNLRIILIGERTNVFHCLPQIERYPSFEAFLGYEHFRTRPLEADHDRD